MNATTTATPEESRTVLHTYKTRKGAQNRADRENASPVGETLVGGHRFFTFFTVVERVSDQPDGRWLFPNVFDAVAVSSPVCVGCTHA